MVLFGNLLRTSSRLIYKTVSNIGYKQVSLKIKIERNMATAGAPIPSSEEIAQDQLLRDVFGMVEKFNAESADRTSPVVEFRSPDELKSIIDFGLHSKPADLSAIKKLCQKVLKYSVKSAHPRFFNQQYGGLDKYGLAAEMIVAAVNANCHTFEVAPLLVMTEKAVIEKALRTFNYPNGEGTFCPGGTYSSMMATNLAKFRKFPDGKEKGLFGAPRMVMFASEQAHYSASKNALLLGIGTENCIKIPCDNVGKMVVSELEKEIVKAKNEGAIPFFAIATAGTTVLGAFDAFHEVADVCQEHGLWLHVDACWGGSAILSKTHRHLCDGIERSDSLAWNAHKMLMMPLQCSLFLSRHKGLMHQVNNCDVPYLFQPKKPYDISYDVARDLIQCGRKADGFKLWLAWKARGDEGLEKHVDKVFDNAQYLTELLKKRDHFRLVIPNPECTNVSFWYVPPSLRGVEEDEKFWEKMHLVVPEIKRRMQVSGTLLVGYQPLAPLVNFFRMVITNERATHEDMEFVLDEIERNGADL